MHRSRSTFALAAAFIAATFALSTTMAHAADDSGDRGQAELLGPLRIRDMTPFNLLRLDMLPAHAVDAAAGTWAIEADLSFSNTFVMSDNVRRYLSERGDGGRGGRAPLSARDADAILAMGEDAFYVDGEFGLLELTAHYRVARRTSVYLTLSAYDFSGGFMDGAIEGFHDAFSLENAGRDLVSRRKFQTVMALDGTEMVALDAPVGNGLGDPVIGLRQAFPLGDSRRWGLVVSGEAKIAWRGERLFLSTGTN